MHRSLPILPKSLDSLVLTTIQIVAALTAPVNDHARAAVLAKRMGTWPKRPFERAFSMRVLCAPNAC